MVETEGETQRNYAAQLKDPMDSGLLRKDDSDLLLKQLAEAELKEQFGSECSLSDIDKPEGINIW
jgi:hypothetical protein